MSIRATTASFLLVALAACQGDAKHSAPTVATPAVKPTPTPASTPAEKPAPAPTPAPASTPAPSRAQIAVGMAYGCVRTAGGTLTCWGRTFPDKPALVAGMTDVAGVVTGQSTACAWTSTGAVYCSEGGPAARVANIDDAVEVAIDADAFDRCARRTRCSPASSARGRAAISAARGLARSAPT